MKKLFMLGLLSTALFSVQANAGDPNGSMTNCGFLDGHVETVSVDKFREMKSSNIMMFLQGWRNVHTVQ